MIFESKYGIGDKVWEVHIDSGDGYFDIEIKEKIIEEITFYENSKGIQEEYRFVKDSASMSCYEIFNTYEEARDYVVSKINKVPYGEKGEIK